MKNELKLGLIIIISIGLGALISLPTRNNTKERPYKIMIDSLAIKPYLLEEKQDPIRYFYVHYIVKSDNGFECYGYVCLSKGVFFSLDETRDHIYNTQGLKNKFKKKDIIIDNFIEIKNKEDYQNLIR